MALDSEAAAPAGPPLTSTPIDANDHTTGARSLTFADQLDALGYRSDEFVAVCRKKRGGEFTSAVMPPALAPQFAETLGDGFDIWYSINATAGPAREGAGRGTESQTTRLCALPIDLDFKAGGCADLAVGEKIVDEVSALLGQRPAFVVASGHGLQPVWAVEDGDINETFTTADAKSLLGRFGRFVAVVAENYGAAVDSVFDLPRVMRVSNTMNLKGEPVRVTGHADVGGPLTVAELDERLTEVGIDRQPDDTSGELVSDPTGWVFAERTCPYVTTMVDGWATDTPAARNPWACSQAVRLLCAWRLGCIAEADFRRAIALLEARLATLLATTEPRRALRRYEIRDVFKLGQQRAACKTDEAARAELGHHAHDDDPWGTGLAPSVVGNPTGEPLGTLHASGDTAAPADRLEGAIEQCKTALRIRREALRRLDAEDRPQVAPPSVKNLETLLAEPDSPTRYRIEGLMPEGSRVLLSAQYKAAKTTMVNNLIRALADGGSFLEYFPVNASASGVVSIDNELGENMRRQWIGAQGIRNTSAVVDVVSLRGKVGTFDLLDDRCRGQWAQRLSDVGCDFLLFDCLRPVLDALGLDENHDAGKFLVAFDALLDEAGVANALVVHHMGHSGERARGDSRLQDWPDAIWRIVRESDEPDSPRYFSAFGRDVNVPEGRLTFDPANRHMGYVGGSRGDAKTEAAKLAVIKLLAERGPMSGSAIESALTDDGHPRDAIRAAYRRGAADGSLRVERGANNAKLHGIAHPCSGCGMPVSSGRETHESCAS